MIAILTYHAIDEQGDVLSTPPRLFEEQMQRLAACGVRVAPLDEVPVLLARRGPAEPAVALTFDDGFQSVHRHALPVLARYGFPATVFLATDYCGRTNDWPSQPPAIVRRPLLGWSDIRALSEAGVVFGSHTRRHPDLTTLANPAVTDELAGSKRAIEDVTGRPVTAFAYPYGAHDTRIRELARAHFALACVATLGFVTTRSDPFALARLDSYYLRHPARVGRLFSWDVRAYLGLRAGARVLRARAARAARLPMRGGDSGRDGPRSGSSGSIRMDWT